jgi:hypothetical protein
MPTPEVATHIAHITIDPRCPWCQLRIVRRKP